MPAGWVAARRRVETPADRRSRHHEQILAQLIAVSLVDNQRELVLLSLVPDPITVDTLALNLARMHVRFGDRPGGVCSEVIAPRGPTAGQPGPGRRLAVGSYNPLVWVVA